MPIITKLSDAEREEALGEEPREMTLCLGDGRVIPVALMMDGDGNPTEIPFDAVTLLAGSAELGWFEIDVADGSWRQPTAH